MTQEGKPKHERAVAHYSLIEWSLIISIFCLGVIGLIQGFLEEAVFLSAICGLILAGISIALMRERFHVFLEQYEFSLIWLIVLVIAGYGIYHATIGVLL